MTTMIHRKAPYRFGMAIFEKEDTCCLICLLYFGHQWRNVTDFGAFSQLNLGTSESKKSIVRDREHHSFTSTSNEDK